MKPIISAIIPINNSQKHIKQCVDSILNQSFQDFELILVDDGSVDESPKICDDYAQKDVRVKVLHKKNGGVSSARNEGIKVANGEFITFIDSDDYIEKEMLAYLYKKEKETSADIVVSGLVMDKWENGKIVQSDCYKIDQDREYTPKTMLEVWGQDFPAICMCGPCCKLYKSEIVKGNDIIFDINLNCGEDTCFNLDVLAVAEKIYFSEKVFYHYRRESEDSLFSKFHKDTYEIHYKVYGKMREFMVALGCDGHAMNRFENNYFSLLLGGLHEYFRFYEKTTKKEKKDLVKKISQDKNIKKLKLKNVSGVKNKVLLFLLKCHCYRLVLYIFKRHYQK